MDQTDSPAKSSVAFVEIVLAVLMTAVVVAVGVSAYRTFSIRSEVDDTLSATSALRTAIAEFYTHERRTPADEHEASLSAAVTSAARRFHGSLRIVAGRIDLVYGAGADRALVGRLLSLTPYETAALEIFWICGNRIPGPGLEPLGFSAGGPRAEQRATTIEARYLPAECR